MTSLYVPGTGDILGLGNNIWRWGASQYGWPFFLRSYEGGVVYMFGESYQPVVASRRYHWEGETGFGLTMRDFGAGTGQVRPYLNQHPRETDEKYNWRRDAGYLMNFCRPVVDVPLDYIYSREAAVSTPESKVWEGKYAKDFDQFRRNVTGRDETLHDFMYTRASKFSSILGHTFVLVDKPSETGMSGVNWVDEPPDRPYCKMIYPWNVLDWELDPMGRMLWVVIREPVFGRRTPEQNYVFNTGDEAGKKALADESFTYLMLTPNEWARYTKDGKRYQSGRYDLGKVPLVPVYTTKSVIHQLCGVSVLNDIAHINQWIFNLCSFVQEIHAKCSFPFLAIPMQAGARGTVSEIGTENAFYYDPSKQESAPQFVEPGVASLTDMSAWIDKLIKEIWRMAVMRQIGGTYSGDTMEQSGASKSADFQDSDRMFQKRASYYEEAETEVFDLWCRWVLEPGDYEKMRADGVLPTSEYGKDYELRPLKRQLEEAIMMVSPEFRMPPNFAAEVKKRIVNASGIVRGDDAKRKEIEEVIDEQADEDVETNAAQDALALLQMENEVKQPAEEKPKPELKVPA